MEEITRKNTILQNTISAKRSPWVHGLLLALAYFAAGKLGLGFAVIADTVTLLWPPSGIALFALLVFGARLWPAIILGALAANLSTGMEAGAAVMIAAGNCLGTLAGFYLLKASGFDNQLNRVRDVFGLVVLGAGLGTIISASMGALVLAAFEIVPLSALGWAWLAWWMGDALGVLVFSSFLLAWWGKFGIQWLSARTAEGILLVLCLLSLTQLAFGQQWADRSEPLPLAFAIFPLVMWAALRFKMRGSTGATLVVGLIVLLNIFAGQGLFFRESPVESLTLLWIYTSFVAVTGMVLAASTSERSRAEEKMRHLAGHDALTGLPNRITLQARIEQAVLNAGRDGQPFAVLFVDIDRFKSINDTLGHSVGDRFLEMVGARLHGCVRRGDLLTRHGGDEFLILLEGIRRSEDAGKIALKILDELQKPFSIEQMSLHVSASIGISFFPKDGRDPDTLIRHADTAMYRAKDSGRNNFVFYSPDMNALAAERLATENELRGALDRGEFLLHYQPQYQAGSGRLVGAEALLRWRRANGELVQPDGFIPLLEETGLIDRVGAWVLETACAQLALWQARHGSALRMAVNVSSHQLRGSALVEQVAALFATCRLAPGTLELEITESMLVGKDSVIERNLEQLVKLGVRLALDDFGTGYSSLSYLHRLSIDTLKVDRSFVAKLPSDGSSAAIAQAIVGLGKGLHLELVAEGVESPEQQKFLQELGCDTMQGYLLGRPVSAEEFGQLLERPGRPATVT